MIIYRIEHKKSKAGMWYDYNGEYNGLIKTLSEGKSKHIPMLLRPKLDDKNWFSGVLSLQQLLEWFSNKDIEVLTYTILVLLRGYIFYITELIIVLKSK